MVLVRREDGVCFNLSTSHFLEEKEGDLYAYIEGRSTRIVITGLTLQRLLGINATSKEVFILEREWR